MPNRIKQIVIFIAVAAVVGLLLASSFLSVAWQEPIKLAISVIAFALFATLAINNKITGGVFFPPRTRTIEDPERFRVREARSDIKFKIFLYVSVSFMLSIPFLAVLRHYGWSFNQAMIAPALICGALYWAVRRIKAARASRSV
jgi:hypothetical protein